MSVERDPVPAGASQASSPVPPDNVPARPTRAQRRGLLGLILALGFVHGLLYVAVFPPWQHYDEPTHFEYIRLIAERGRLPKPGEFDLSMRQEIASSMQAADFWKGATIPSIDFWSQVSPNIGVSELYHPPVYYALLAVPQWLVQHSSVETQLYLARFCSVLLYLVVLASAYGLVHEAFPQRRWLPASVAAFLALLPPFTDIMSSVNNDVGAAAATSVFLFSCVRLARRGFSLQRMVICLILAGLCIAVKTTAGVVALVVMAVLGLSYLPQNVRRWCAIAGAVLLVAGLLAAVNWREHAAYWYSNAPTSAPNRVVTPAPEGRWALALSGPEGPYPRIVFQELNLSTGRSLRGHTLTFGAWIKAAEGSAVPVFLSLDDGRSEHRLRVVATQDWGYYTYTATVSSNARGLAAYAMLPEKKGVAQAAFLDELVLLDGGVPIPSAPTSWTDGARADGASTPAVNLLRNPSAEGGWPGLRGWVGSRTIFREPIARIFHSVLDWQRTGWVYQNEARMLFISFWGSFGWNRPVLPKGNLYPLGALAFLALAGAVLGLGRLRRDSQLKADSDRRVVLVLALALVVGWGETIARVHPALVTKHITWPLARYADVVIVPTALLLCLGWTELVPRRLARAAAWLGFAGLILLDALALCTILPYYYGPI